MAEEDGVAMNASAALDNEVNEKSMLVAVDGSEKGVLDAVRVCPR